MSYRKAIMIALSVLAVAMMVSCAYAPVSDAEENKVALIIDIDAETKSQKFGSNSYWNAEEKVLTLGAETLGNVFIDDFDNVKIVVKDNVTFKDGVTNYPAIYFSKDRPYSENNVRYSLTIEGKGSITVNDYVAGIDAFDSNLIIKDTKISINNFMILGLSGYTVYIDSGEITLSTKNDCYRYIGSGKGIFCDNLPMDQLNCVYDEGDNLIAIYPKEGGTIIINPIVEESNLTMKIVVIAAAFIAIICFGYALLGKKKETA